VRSRNGGPRAQSRDDGWRGAGGEAAAGSGEARRVDSRVTRATTLLLLSVLSQTASIHGLIEGAEQFRKRVDRFDPLLRVELDIRILRTNLIF